LGASSADNSCSGDEFTLAAGFCESGDEPELVIRDWPMK